MTKTLMLMRHGKSSWKEKELRDYERPLKKKGAETSENVGKLLKLSGMTPDLIYSSPAQRASQTAEIVAKSAGYHNVIQYFESFYMGEPHDYIQPLKELDDDVKRVLLIGHNPGLEALLQLLEGKVNALSTGALASVELELKHWRDLNTSTVGELVVFWDPDEMDLGEIEEKMAKEKKDEEKKEKVKKDKEEKVEKKLEKKEEKLEKKEKKEKKDKKDKKSDKKEKDKKDKKEKKDKKDKKDKK